MKSYKTSTGFALPTVLMVSVIMLAVLTAAVASSVSIRNALQDQSYNRMARQAADSGTVYAQNCMDKNNDQVTWTETNPLRPNTDCNGIVQEDLSGYVVNTDEMRTYFVVGVGSEGAINSQGYVEALRSSDGVAWRFWSASKAFAQTAPNTFEALEAIYPVGSVYISGSSSMPDIIADLGTWQRIEGRFIVGASDSDGSFDVGDTGGAKTHTLTDAEVPDTRILAGDGSSVAMTTGNYGWPSGSYRMVFNENSSRNLKVNGGGGAHNNLPPYKAKYMWERTN